MLQKQLKRDRRHKRVRSKVKGTVKVPRLCVFRSNKHIAAQLIDDKKAHTLVAANDIELKKQKADIKNKKIKEKTQKVSGKIALALEVGRLLAQKATDKKIKKVVFDRGGYKYHGRVKAVAEGAREAGLEF